MLILVVLVVIAVRRGRARPGRSRVSDPQIKVTHLNEKSEDTRDAILRGLVGRKEYRALMKERAKKEKAEEKAEEKAKAKGKEDGKSAPDDRRPRVFVLDFHGDINATQVSSLREQVSALIGLAKAGDEVVVRLESPGGVVHAYGLAAAQLARLRERGVPLTVCVDKVAASGGYMMACLANKIVCAPFAVVGSIGVVANVPNLNRFLKNKDVDYLELTAGEYKRTVTMFGEITEKGKAKFLAQLDDTHALFKDHIAQYRAQVDVQRVGTGEHWFGVRALELKLVDELRTSDDYLLEAYERADVYLVEMRVKERLKDRVLDIFSKLPAQVYERFLESQRAPPF